MSKNPNRNPKHVKYVHLLNDKRWKMLRQEQLRLHPLCQMHEKEGKIVSAQDVHHITAVESVPFDQMEAYCYDPKNLISLCRECHIKVHKDMKSHQGQLTRSLPKPETEDTDAHMVEWVKRVSGGEYKPPEKKRKFCLKTRFGWVTKEEYKQKMQEQLEAWVKSKTNPNAYHVDGLKK